MAYGFAAATAAAMACTWAGVRVRNDPMPPLPASMADWIPLAVRALRLKIGAIGPWQPWQFDAYNATPSSAGAAVCAVIVMTAGAEFSAPSLTISVTV